jgi:putative FmdB family regulatory protein
VPTYQYACTECEHSFEQFQSFSDDALTVCPQCQGRLRKVFNAVGVVFKGSGFYRNDSRSADAKAKAGSTSDGASGDKPAKKSESGSDSGGDKAPSADKPAAKSGSEAGSGSGSGSGSSEKAASAKGSPSAA